MMGEATHVEAPVEFYDQEQEAPIAFRCDLTTRNQAKKLIADIWDVPYARVRIRKAEMRWDQSWVDEMVADGAEEPYDGWPAWVECGPDDPRGVAYWTSGGWDEPDLYDLPGESS